MTGTGEVSGEKRPRSKISAWACPFDTLSRAPPVRRGQPSGNGEARNDRERASAAGVRSGRTFRVARPARLAADALYELEYSRVRA